MRIKIILTDDKKNIYDGETVLKLIGKRKDPKKEKDKISPWYKTGCTTEKIVCLIDEGFFDKARSLIEIVDELKSKDYHFKSSDLTLPMRRIVRKKFLNKTKVLSNDKKSKNWMYIKA